jgi:hypothetical protein
VIGIAFGVGVQCRITATGRERDQQQDDGLLWERTPLRDFAMTRVLIAVHACAVWRQARVRRAERRAGR